MAPITATFALFLGVGLTGLAINTTRLRVRFGRDLDKPAKEAIRRASRAHGNTVEHGLTVTVLMFFAETHGVGAAWLQAIAALFLGARVLYAFGYLTRPTSPPMQIGAATTYALEILLLNLLALALFG
ncbi:MAG: MAPEG family protein [Myxococcales bacterium]|nr:MAPEG family protein [Myxococcales bacterium]